MGDGVGSVHCFFERAGDVAHHGQAKEHSEQNTGHHRADRQGTHVVIAGGGGGVLFLGLVELQLQQTAHVFPQWGVGRAHLVVVQLFAQVQVNPDTGTVEWPNGADLNPVILYDWSEVGMRIVAERQARYAAAPAHRANTQALANAAGSWHDVDTDAFVHAVREQRDQSYRPPVDL